MFNKNRKVKYVSVLAVFLFIGMFGVPCIGGQQHDATNGESIGKFTREFVSAISISYSPELHPYDVVHSTNFGSMVTRVEAVGSRYVVAPGFKVKFRPEDDYVSTGHLFFNVPFSVFLSSFSGNRGGGSGVIEGGTTEIAYGVRFGLSVRAVGGLFVSLGYSRENLYLSYRMAESIFDAGRYIGSTVGEKTVRGQRHGLMPGVNYAVSGNLYLSLCVIFASNTFDDSEIGLRLPVDTDEFESRTKIEPVDGRVLELGVSFVW